MVISVRKASLSFQLTGTVSGTCQSCKRGVFPMCRNEAINGVTRDGECG